jgi:predicted metal-dependent phosphotriesterase family hydrolase
VNPNYVVIGHLNDIKEQPTAAPLAIAKRGAYVAFDHSGRPYEPRLPEYVRTIKTVLKPRHEDRLFLYSDFVFSRQKDRRKNGGPGTAMVMTTMVARLRQAGVNETALHKILVENRRRVLAFVPKAITMSPRGDVQMRRRRTVLLEEWSWASWPWDRDRRFEMSNLGWRWRIALD